MLTRLANYLIVYLLLSYIRKIRVCKSFKCNDEDSKDTNTSNSRHEKLPINIKEEAVKVDLKTEDDTSTDDERSPDCLISSSLYDPVNSEEIDDEDTEEDTTLNEQHSPIKKEVKTEDISVDEEHNSEKKDVGHRVNRTESDLDIHGYLQWIEISSHRVWRVGGRGGSL